MAIDESFVEFVHARSAALMRTAYLLTGDRGVAEDLVQSSLLAAFRSWSRIREPAARAAYVQTILVRQTLSWRHRRGRSDVLMPTVPEPAHTGEWSVSDERTSLWPLVLTLSERQRAVVVLAYYEDLRETDIAAVLGCSTGAVKSHRARALRALRERLTPEESIDSPTSQEDQR